MGTCTCTVEHSPCESCCADLAANAPPDVVHAWAAAGNTVVACGLWIEPGVTWSKVPSEVTCVRCIDALQDESPEWSYDVS